MAKKKYKYRRNNLSEELVIDRLGLRYIDVITIDIVHSLSLTVCDCVFLRDNLTIGIGEKAQKGN